MIALPEVGRGGMCKILLAQVHVPAAALHQTPLGADGQNPVGHLFTEFMVIFGSIEKVPPCHDRHPPGANGYTAPTVNIQNGIVDLCTAHVAQHNRVCAIRPPGI